MPSAEDNKAGCLQFGTFLSILSFPSPIFFFFFLRQRLPGPLWSELQVDTAGKEIFFPRL